MPAGNKRINTNRNCLLKHKYSDFNSVALPHLQAIRNYALKITHHSEDSEDLVQETMFKAFKFFDSFEKGTNIKGWLYRIMFNSFINDYRIKSKEPVKVCYEDVQDFYSFINVEDVKTRQAENDAFNNVLNDEIIDALSLLPDDFRTIVFLKDVEGYTYQEIADFMGCLLGTVRSRLHRAREILYALLYQYAKDTGFLKADTNRDKKTPAAL